VPAHRRVTGESIFTGRKADFLMYLTAQWF
jgi:hypothetical protein